MHSVVIQAMTCVLVQSTECIGCRCKSMTQSQTSNQSCHIIHFCEHGIQWQIHIPRSECDLSTYWVGKIIMQSNLHWHHNPNLTSSASLHAKMSLENTHRNISSHKILHSNIWWSFPILTNHKPLQAVWHFQLQLSHIWAILRKLIFRHLLGTLTSHHRV